jgi:DNA transformation protein
MGAHGFVDHVLDLFSPWGGVSARRMFGGHGVYRRGVMFGLIIQETLYLKTDDVNRPAFEERDLGPFVFQAKGRAVSLSYFEVPPECVDDGDELRRWSEGALAAAGRQKKPVKKKAPRRAR